MTSDLVSKDDVIHVIHKYFYNLMTEHDSDEIDDFDKLLLSINKDISKTIKELPSVTPQPKPSIDRVCDILAEMFETPCNYRFNEIDIDVFMSEDAYCENHCSDGCYGECWKRFFEKYDKFSKESEEEQEEVLSRLSRQWIPTSERMPENLGRYLTYIINKNDEKLQYIMTCEYIASDLWNWFPDDDCASDNVVAWMPLPEPYKVESEE